MRMINHRRFFLLCCTWMCTTRALAEQGFLGISFSIEGEGLIVNRLVKTIRVERVVSRSPAARSGIQIGDELVEVDNKTVRGARVSELRPLLDKAAGQAVTLSIKKPSGQLRTVTVVLDPRPAE